MNNNESVLKKIVTILVLITVLMALLFGTALYNHFFNPSEKEVENDFYPVKPPSDTIPRDPVVPPAID